MVYDKMAEDREQRLNQILAEFLVQADAGTAPDQAEFTNRFPEFAVELAQFFEDRRHLMAAACETTAPMFPVEMTNIVRYVGDYELLQKIAEGGMGVIFRARQISLGRPVAVKMIRSGVLATAEDVSGFRHEASAAANLEHPNIVPIYEIGEHEGRHYFSMKLIEGENLATLRRGEPAVSAEEQRQIVSLMLPVIRAVGFAHERGFIHRDLKPENILVDRSGQPYVADFGLALRLDRKREVQTGGIAGTVRYMAPEQARGEPLLTTAVDIYALGAILFEKLTGVPPFRGDRITDVLRQVCEDEVPVPRSLNEAIHPNLEAICLKCTARMPEQRYSSAADLADDLVRFMDGLPVAARPLNFAESARRWFQSNLLTAAVILLMGVFGGLLLGVPDVMSWHARRDAGLQTRLQVDGSSTLVPVRPARGNGPHALTIPAILGAAFGTMLWIRPKQRSGDIAVGGALGFVLTFSYLMIAGASALSRQNQWETWENRMSAAIEGLRLPQSDLDQQAADLRDTLNSLQSVVSTAFREMLLTSTIYVAGCLLTSLFTGRLLREQPRQSVYWVGGSIGVCLLAGIISLMVSGWEQQGSGYLALAVIPAFFVLAHYLGELLSSSPALVQKLLGATILTLVVWRLLIRFMVSPEWNSAIGKLVLCAWLLTLIVASLTSGVAETDSTGESESDAVSDPE